MKYSRLFVFTVVCLAAASQSRLSSADNICNETVPADRFIDGIPAYDQCPESTNASIYSNDGINTSITSNGSDWVRTQWSGGYQCTELAARYLLFKWNVSFMSGNAMDWCNSVFPATVVTSTTPVHGDVAVFGPGACGASPITGHVVVVDSFDTVSSRFTFVEQNQAGRRSCPLNTATCFIHVVANNGDVSEPVTPNDSGLPPDAGLFDASLDGGVGIDSSTATDSGNPLPGNDSGTNVVNEPFDSGVGRDGGGAGGAGGYQEPVAGSNSIPDNTPAGSVGGSIDSGTNPGPKYTYAPQTYGSNSGCSCNLTDKNNVPPNVLLLFFGGFFLYVFRKRAKRMRSS